MQRVVYAPEVFAYVYTSQGNWIDLSPDIISGSISRKVNQVSTATLLLQNTPDPNDTLNPNRVYMGGQITPMDRITIYLKRDYPVQVFSGYIDLAPYWQPYPRPVQIEASCTLKRLEFTYWDPGLVAVVDILTSLGFSFGPGGQSAGYIQMDPKLYAGRPQPDITVGGETDSVVADTGFIALLKFLLEDVGQWNPNGVFIEPLPPSWIDKALNIYQQAINDENALKTSLDALFTSSSGGINTGQSGPPVTEFRGSPSLFQANMKKWITNYILTTGLADESDARSYGSSFAYQAYTYGKKQNVDPRLLLALAAVANFNLRGPHQKIENHNPFGGKNISTWAQAFAEVATAFKSGTFERTSITTIVDSGWFTSKYAGPKNYSAATKAVEADKIAFYYQELLDYNKSGNVTWDAAERHPSGFQMPKQYVRQPKKPVPTPPPKKNAYIELHAVSEYKLGNAAEIKAAKAEIARLIGGIHSGTALQKRRAAIVEYAKIVGKTPAYITRLISPANNIDVDPLYANEASDNVSLVVDPLVDYIQQHPNWKMSIAHYAYNGFDTVEHDVSVFIRHYPDVPGHAKHISISTAPNPSANSLRLAKDLRDGLADRGMVLTTSNFKKGPDSSYNGLIKDHAKAAVVIRMPAASYETAPDGTTRESNENLVLAIANGLYKYKHNVLNNSLTEDPTFSTPTSGYGYRIFAKAYRSKVIPGDVAQGQNFTFKGTVPFYSIGDGVVSYNKKINGQEALFVTLNSSIGGYDCIFYIGGKIDPGLLKSFKKVKAGEKLGTFTHTSQAIVGLTSSNAVGSLPGGTNTFAGAAAGALATHQLLVSQMPDLPDNPNALPQGWSLIPNVAVPTVGDGTNTNVTGFGSAIAAFNTTLDTPINIVSSNLLSGYRSYENAIKLFDTVEQIVTSSMRVFASLPDGSFIAWYPDYFNLSGQNPYYYINSNEIVDFTVDINDAALITHSYVLGAPYGPSTFSSTQSVEQIMGAGVASIDMPGIVDSFFHLDSAPTNLANIDAIAQNTLAVTNFFNRYGVRPQLTTQTSIRHPLIEFFYAYHNLLKAWAQQYISNLSLTFLPELFPGMTIQIETNDAINNPGYCVYVEEVQHNFDYQNGFTTTAQVSSLSRPQITDVTSFPSGTASYNPGGGTAFGIGPAPGLALVNNFVRTSAIIPSQEMTANINYFAGSVQPPALSTILNPDGSLGSNTTQLLQTLGWN